MARWQKVIMFSALLGPFLGSCADTPTEWEPETLADRLHKALSDAFSHADGKGVSVTVLVSGEPLWTGVAGTSHGTELITPNSVFAAGSITKTFTAITILRLAEEGLLSLDDSLHAWFPPYPYVDPDITIRELLNHTSGLSDFTDHPTWFSELMSEPGRIWGTEEYFLATIRPAYFEKSTAWSYSTSGYLLLRMLIGDITGMSIAQAYDQYVVEPLSLQNTYVCPGQALPPTLTHGWMDLTGDGFYDDLTSLGLAAFCSCAGGQVFSTSGDLAKLANALMLDRTILTANSYAEMTDFYYPSGHDEPMVKGYGLGLMWFGESVTWGYKVWGHGGDAPGYAAGSLFLPNLGVVIGIMDNTEEGESMEVLNPILKVVEEHLGNR